MRRPQLEKAVTLEWPTRESADEIRSRIEYVKEFNADALCVTAREFRYNVQQLLELNIPVIVRTRRGVMRGVYTPLGHKHYTAEGLRKIIDALRR